MPKYTTGKTKPRKLGTRLENELERKYGIFRIAGKTKPEACQGNCFCEKFKFMDDEGLCPKKVHEKILRSTTQQEKMRIADEKREEAERKEAEKAEKNGKSKPSYDNDEEEEIVEEETYD